MGLSWSSRPEQDLDREWAVGWGGGGGGGAGREARAVIWTHVCNLRVPGRKAPVQSRKQTSPVLGQSPGRLPLN